ncbi:MAG: FtsW/RodA/SpoVE family cell cycle protein, partial [Acidobacteriaceae bacterium]|nr:FtsW/RodA/SpoVE family cell cycle protein [Acidobacteriaceae bacterium]
VPNKGIPLPFMSYGGSSLLSTTLLMGMLLSVSEHTT